MKLRSSRILTGYLSERSQSVDRANLHEDQSSSDCLVDIFECIANPIMEIELDMASPRGSTTIRLDRWQDWTLWFDQMRIWCIRNNIWDEVNPELAGEQPENKRPKAPSYPSELSNESRANFQIQNAVYTNEIREWKDKEYALRQLDENIKSTVGEKFKQHLMNQLTERAKLKSLFENVKPQNSSIKADLKIEYDLLKNTPYGKTVDEYLSRWQMLSMKCQVEEHCIFVTGEEEPSLVLHEALQKIHPITAIFRINMVNDRVNEEKKVKLTDEINAWKTFLQSKGITRFPAKGSDGSNNAFSSASFQGKTNGSLDRDSLQKMHINQQQNTENRPECLCGKRHNIAYCNYLNPKRPRPQWWKPNKQIKESIEKYCKNHPSFARKVRDEIQSWESSKGSKFINSSNPGTQNETSNSSDIENVGAMSLAGSNSICSLFDSVILDSGTNIHIINRTMTHRIIDSREATSVDTVHCGDGILQATAVVKAEVHLKLGEKLRILTLHDAIYIPNYMSNLVSLKRLNKVGIHHDSSVPLQLYRLVGKERHPWADLTMSKSEHWILEKISSPNSAYAVSSTEPRKPLITSPEKWHKILGHPGVKAIESLPNNTLGCGFDSEEKISTIDCEPCLLSKAKLKISRRSEKNREISVINETKHMTVVSWDISEISQGLDGSKYLSHFYYDNESYHHVKCTKTKAEAVAYFKIWFPKSEHLFGARTAFIRTDNEGSIGKEATKILDKYKLTRLASAAGTPAQNGAAEVSGKLIVQTARTLRIAASLPNNLWPWLCETAAYLLNRTPTKKLTYKTPYEIVTGKKPSLSHLHQIGCKAFALEHGIPRREKMNERAHIGYHLGYASSNIFLIWIPKLNRVIRTRDVVLKDELYKPMDDITLGQLVDEKQHIMTVKNIEVPEDDSLIDLDPYISASVPIFQAGQQIDPECKEPKDPQEMYPTPSPTISREQSQDIDENNSSVEDSLDVIANNDVGAAVAYLGAFSAFLGLKNNSQSNLLIHRDQLPPPPASWSDLMKHDFKEKFLAATQLEFNHLKNETFEIVHDYCGHTVPLKWVWTYKFDSNGFLIKFKARMCVRGDLQLPTLQETYAATLAIKTFRAMMAIMCAFGLESRQYDLVNAFCNAKLNPSIYCKLPPGFEHLGGVLKVRRALYGLRESPLLWLRTLKDALYQFGFEDIPGVDCLMTGRNVIILFYVDDILLLYWPQDIYIAQEFDCFLSSRFKTTCSGEAKWFLGINIIRDKINKRLWLSQQSYCEKIGIKFNIEGRTNYPKLPLPPSINVSKNQKQATKSQIQGYQQKIGSIGYAAVSTRPDVARSHAVLAQFLQNPSEECLGLADHLISYLYGSKDLCLCFDGNGVAWEIFCDASYADNDDRKSSQGLLFKMFGGAVEWKATKQKTITTSTTEAELLALSSIASSSYWWQRLFAALNFDTGLKPTIRCDNQQTVKIANSDIDCIHTKLRHVDIHQLWIRQETSKGKMNVEWIPTTKQEADGFTKLLSRQNFEVFINHIGLRHLPCGEEV